MHNLLVSRKSSFFYIFKPNVSQCLFTLFCSLPSLSLYTFPLNSPSLSAIILPHSPPPSISLHHPFWSVAVAGTLVSTVPFSNLTVPTAIDYRYVALPFYYFVLHLFCGKWMIIRGGSRITKIFNFFPFVLWVWRRFRFCVGKKRW